MIAGSELTAWLDDRDRVAGSMAAARRAGHDWNGGPWCRALREALDAIGDADPAEVIDVAQAAMARIDQIEAEFGGLIAAAGADPFFLPPLVQAQGELNTALLLFDHPLLSIALGLTQVDALAAKKGSAGAPASLGFTGHRTLFRFIRSGQATLSFWEAPPAALQFQAAQAQPCRFVSERRVADGEEVLLDGATQTFVIEHAGADILYLQAIAKEAAAPLVTEYDSRTLSYVGASSADESASRVQMMVTLLRLMDRQDAAPLIIRALDTPHFHTRWHIMRELLALDAEAALPPLRDMATSDPHPEVRAAAAATLHTFFGEETCPA